MICPQAGGRERWAVLCRSGRGAALAQISVVRVLTPELDDCPSGAGRVGEAAGTCVGGRCDTEHARSALADAGGVP